MLSEILRSSERYLRSRQTTLKQLEIVELVAVLHDILLDLAANSPGDEVFHVPRDQEGRVTNFLDADTDVALLDELRGGLNSFGHAQAEEGIRR